MLACRDSRMNTTSKHPQPFPKMLSITAGQPLPTALSESVSLMCGLLTLKFQALSICTAFPSLPGSSLARFQVPCFSSLLLIKIIYLSVGLGLNSQLVHHCSGSPVKSYWASCSFQNFFVPWGISQFYLPLNTCAWFIPALTSHNSNLLHHFIPASLNSS